MKLWGNCVRGKYRGRMSQDEEKWGKKYTWTEWQKGKKRNGEEKEKMLEMRKI